MGLFSTPKCPLHRVKLSVGKNYMCQLYYYCPKCSAEKRKQKDLENRIKALEGKNTN